MASVADASAIVNGFATMLQWAVAIQMLRGPRGVFRDLATALLAVNGIVTLLVALQAVRPALPGLIEATLLVDAPTGLLVALIALAVWVERSPDSLQWTPRWALMAVVVLPIAAVGTAAYLVLPDGARPWVTYAYAVAPLFIGYAILMAGLVWRLWQAPAVHCRFYALISLAFGARIMEFAWIYGVADGPANLARLQGWEPSSLAAGPALSLTLVAAGALLGVAALAAFNESKRMWGVGTLVVLGAAMANGMLTSSVFAAESSLGVYTLSVLSMAIVRPVLLLIAMNPRSSPWPIGLSFATWTSFLSLKAFFAALLGADPWTLGVADGLALGVTASAAVVGVWIVFERRPPAPDATVGREGHAGQNPPLKPHPPRVRISNAHRLAACLLVRPPESGYSGITHSQIHAATRITANNVASEIRRLRALVASDAAVISALEGVRGRRTYRLTEDGQRRVREFLEREGLHAGELLDKRSRSSIGSSDSGSAGRL